MVHRPAHRWRVATAIVAGLLVAACAASPTATSTPTSTPAASRDPAASPQPISPEVGRIAAGYQHTCVLTEGGGVQCWGSNHSGQLGNGTTSEAAGAGPVDVSGLASAVSAIAAGGFHTCALTSGGGVKCWGDNLYGQLGNGTVTPSSVPVDVSGLTSGVSAIAVGWSSTCALTSIGGVTCWGNNHFGWLGDGTTTDRSIPVDVSRLASGVTAISVGTLHTCALTNAGGVTCWGYGQSDDPAVFTSHVPVDVPGLGNGVSTITAGLDRTCALMNDGGITCWGPNYAPPPGESLPARMVPVDVSGLAGGVIVIVAAGQYHTCALTGEGGVACWGSNAYGELGSSSMNEAAEPVEIAALGNSIRAIALGGMHTCALTSGGGVKCWGANEYGQLGSVQRCSSTSVPVDVQLQTDGAHASPSSEPTATPAGRIDHATGPTDVVLRFDRGPDLGVSELTGEFFQPGPEFTLYGNGTVIFRNEHAELPPANASIVRSRPFLIAHLDEEQVQSVLRFAIGEGGLGDACERYETQASDVSSFDAFNLRAGSLDKRVLNLGSAPFEALYDYLDNFGGGDAVSAEVWVPNRYRGNLFGASSAIEIGLLPDPRDVGIAPWPWSNIAPAEFVADPGSGSLRRVMSADEAAVLGLSDLGGVVQRTYLLGPDGDTIYSFSLWPMFPDETR